MPLPSALVSGFASVSTSAAPLASSAALGAGVTVLASPSNTVAVYVGPSGVTTSDGYPLDPGDSTTLIVDNLDAVYLVTSTVSPTQTIRYVGS